MSAEIPFQPSNLNKTLLKHFILTHYLNRIRNGSNFFQNILDQHHQQIKDLNNKLILTKPDSPLNLKFVVSTKQALSSSRQKFDFYTKQKSDCSLDYKNKLKYELKLATHVSEYANRKHISLTNGVETYIQDSQSDLDTKIVLQRFLYFLNPERFHNLN